MNELAKEIADSLHEAIVEVPHQQLSQEVVKLIIAAAQAVTIIRAKFSK